MYNSKAGSKIATCAFDKHLFEIDLLAQILADMFIIDYSVK